MGDFISKLDSERNIIRIKRIQEDIPIKSLKTATKDFLNSYEVQKRQNYEDELKDEIIPLGGDKQSKYQKRRSLKKLEKLHNRLSINKTETESHYSSCFSDKSEQFKSLKKKSERKTEECKKLKMNLTSTKQEKSDL